MAKKSLSLILFIFLFSSFANAQRAEITISLNERFFEALLDALLKGDNPPEFPLAGKVPNSENQLPEYVAASFSDGKRAKDEGQNNERCRETLRLHREIDGVRTALRFRQGQITAPIAFSGNYNPPLIGCINFSGVAETNINLEFDQARQTLFGRAQVTNVSLSGSGGVGGNIVARLVQNSIDKRINPIEILQMEKISFAVPLQNSGNLRMKAVGVRQEVFNGGINVYIAYEFLR